ncbi:hypothetical protein [Nonomuraea solani]|nr:hypothetical protein [Nonomuraea solani]
MAIALVVLPPGTGSAGTSRPVSPECGSTSDQQTAIRELVQRTNDRLKVSVKAEDYEVQSDGTNCVVKPRGSGPVTTEVVTDSAGRKTITAKAKLEAAPAIKAGGNATIQQDAQWWQPTCYAAYEDAARVGIMNPICFQWGSMNYTGATRWNYVARMYATCAARKGGPDFWQVYTCSVGTRPQDTSPPLVLNDYSPRSTQTLSGCQNVPLNITAGPVSTGVFVNTCDKLALIKEPSANRPEMEVAWQGRAYWAEDKRETGFLLGMGSPIGQSPQMWAVWSMGVGPCSLPPQPPPWCAM